MKTRPCRVGDVLVKQVSGCGASYEISVVEPPRHPERGTTENHNVTIRLSLEIQNETMECLQDNCSYVMRTKLWHTNFQRVIHCVENGGTAYIKEIMYDGTNLHIMVQEAIKNGDNALKTLQELWDARQHSIRSQESARAAIYAGWPVVDKDEDEDEE